MELLVLSAARSPFATRRGSLSGWHPVVLLASVLERSLEQVAIDPAVVGHVVAACSSPVGEQGLNVGRSATISAGWPLATAACTIDAQALSGFAALRFAAALIEAGDVSCSVAAGVESSSRVPLGSTTGSAVGKPYGPGVHERFARDGGLQAPGVVNDALAASRSFLRSDLDAHVVESRRRFAQASVDNSVCALAVPSSRGKAADLLLRDEVSIVDVSSLSPAFLAEGTTTAANLAPVADGAAAVVLGRPAAPSWSNLEPLAVVRAIEVGVSTPLEACSGWSALQQALKMVDLAPAELGRVELAETSAASALAFLEDAGLDPALVNPDGGTLAIGEPGGAVAPALLARLVHALRRDGHRWGALVQATLDGQSGALVVENPAASTPCG